LLAARCAEIPKLVFGRAGPAAFFAKGVYGFAWFKGQMALSSFPSAYAARVGVAAATLWTITPRYRSTVVLLTLLTTACQVVGRTNFLSDEIAGLAIGICVFGG
jgi:PAP2 superfamily